VPVNVQVHILGLREFRRDLRRLGDGGVANREMSTALKVGLGPVLARARGNAPRRTGALAESLRPFATGLRTGIRSRLPYAGVQHWGGTISPRGAPIEIRRTEFITRAIGAREEFIVDDLGNAVETAAKKTGWR
jgi:hypothetical protein